MRKQFVECKSRAAAKRECPWAYWYAEADGGYWCFESRNDYVLWLTQK